MDSASWWEQVRRRFKLLSIYECKNVKFLKVIVRQKNHLISKNHDLIENCMMLGIYDELISSWKMTGWKPRSVMMKWWDGVTPPGLLSPAPENLRARLKRYQGGKPLQIAEAATSSLHQNLKLMCLEELSLIYTVPSMVWKICQGGPGRGENIVKIGKKKE